MSIKTLGAASAELLAIREGLNTAWERGIRFLELETDAQALTYMIQNPHFYMDHQLFNIINDVSQLLKREWQVTVLHFKRSANKIAHGLAEIGRGMTDDDILFHFYSPPGLTHSYTKELANSISMMDGN
ncbi:uncharacterized protein LOC110712998 [Chenopodium quinoa]|uniref:RNase H type-1 domain-containing protein n=1 Tax=Chenopodium quinoa TaxID=63459 RepID=A0A803MRU6_CHEQI|nr:uncharacterized protein LOC110712998 [Chenopodium quinoa]